MIPFFDFLLQVITFGIAWMPIYLQLVVLGCLAIAFVLFLLAIVKKVLDVIPFA